MIDPREEIIVRAFVQKERRPRSLYLLSDAKRRDSFLAELYHFRWLDARYTSELLRSDLRTGSPRDHCQERPNLSVPNICKHLRSKGAGRLVYVMSTDEDIDAQELPLETVIEAIRRKGAATIVSCLPGKLAYFEGEGEGEDEALILERELSSLPEAMDMVVKDVRSGNAAARRADWIWRVQVSSRGLAGFFTVRLLLPGADCQTS
jgi:hypothetical protein